MRRFKKCLPNTRSMKEQAEMKNILEGINHGLNDTEEQIREMEDEWWKSLRLKRKKKKNKKKNQRRGEQSNQ